MSTENYFEHGNSIRIAIAAYASIIVKEIPNLEIRSKE